MAGGAGLGRGLLGPSLVVNTAPGEGRAICTEALPEEGAAGSAWHRSSTQVRTPGPPSLWQGSTQLCPAAPGQAALALHGPGHLLAAPLGPAEQAVPVLTQSPSPTSAG